MDNEYYDYEDRRYINPTVSRDEQLGFVDKLRNSQNKELDKISRDTYNLGTHIPSNMGGLSGSGGVWAKQYVTPQTNSMLESLKSTAQAQALNDAMTNYQNQLKKRYNDAYKAAAKRRGSGGGGGGTAGGTDDVNGDVGYENLLDFQGIGSGTKPSNASTYYLWDGKNSAIELNRLTSGNSAGIDTGMMSYDVGAPSRQYLDSMYSKGYKLYDSNGNEVGDYASLFPDYVAPSAPAEKYMGVPSTDAYIDTDGKLVLPGSRVNA